jgi:hypothetical protein
MLARGRRKEFESVCFTEAHARAIEAQERSITNSTPARKSNGSRLVVVL